MSKSYIFLITALLTYFGLQAQSKDHEFMILGIDTVCVNDIVSLETFETFGDTIHDSLWYSYNKLITTRFSYRKEGTIKSGFNIKSITTKKYKYFAPRNLKID